MKVLKRIVIIALIAGGLSWVVFDQIQQVRHEHQVRSMLLTIQEGLQRYHVDQEKYIPRESLKGSELITVLLDFEFLSEPPLNPWTGAAWALDGAEPDYLEYGSDVNFETYALRALDPKTGEVFLEIDSVEHLSLE